MQLLPSRGSQRREFVSSRTRRLWPGVAALSVRHKHMSRQLKYEEVVHYLSTYTTEEPPYDFNGLLHLVLAGVENLRVNAIDQDFLDYACSITDEQALFLQRLLDSRAASNAKLEKDK
jgi:hypothetical protein